MELKLTDKGDNFPLKAFPNEEQRNGKILEFGTWLDGLLSLKGEVSAKRLEVMLPMVTEFCWSLSIADMRKAFTAYIKGELPIEPRTNYLDVILFGKVIKEWKALQPAKVVPLYVKEYTEQEKADLIYMGVINAYDSYVQEQRVIPGYTWVYDHLDELKLLNYSKKEKLATMKLAKRRLKQTARENNFMANIEDANNSQLINESKRILLEQYFEKTTKDELIYRIT